MFGIVLIVNAGLKVLVKVPEPVPEYPGETVSNSAYGPQVLGAVSLVS